jgi:hypothetical protein
MIISTTRGINIDSTKPKTSLLSFQNNQYQNSNRPTFTKRQSFHHLLPRAHQQLLPSKIASQINIDMEQPST